jgi:uncharacterized protein (TIGR02246 family)
LADHPAVADDSADVAAIRAAAEAFAVDFNAGNAAGVVARFLPRGELVDEQGRVYQGREELQELFTRYFAEFPGTKLALEIESVRLLGENLAIEEGTRYLSAKDGVNARVRYVTVGAKSDGQWLIASTREFYDETQTPGEQLATLEWLVGEWVSENDDAAVEISYRWDEVENFIVGDFQSTRGGEVVMKSTQRIGWDSQAEKIRSWVFDADGGFAEGDWTAVEGGWVIRSVATQPDGTTGSATVYVTPNGRDQFTMKGTDRIVADGQVDDFEVTVTRAPPTPRAVTEANPAPASGATAVPPR